MSQPTAKPARMLLHALLGLLAAGCVADHDGDTQPASGSERDPNIIIVFADDLGYGDIGVYGNPSISTPNIDQLAADGQRWTNFYSASAVCSPSRAALMTGRYPIRTGLGALTASRRVFFPLSTGGLPERELTIAEVLKTKDYATAAIGKWHLGHQPQFLPTSQGFDSYFGIPYSNDMNMPGGAEVPWSVDLVFEKADISNWDVPLMEDERIVERPANQWTITKRYTERAVEFIESNAERPFFLYLAHSLPHTPVFASEEFWGKSLAGHYGDVVEEIDWSVGQIVATLERLGLDDNTLIVFTSDNGPWLVMRQYGGVAGPLRDGKGTTWEGGMREPAIFWWPGRIMPGVEYGLGSTLDIFATVAALVDAKLPETLTVDGIDLRPTLFDAKESPRESMLFYRMQEIYAARLGAYKAHYVTESDFVPDTNRQVHEPPLLFNVNDDSGERFNIAEGNEEILATIRSLVEAHQSTVVPVDVELEKYPEDESTRKKMQLQDHRPGED